MGGRVGRANGGGTGHWPCSAFAQNQCSKSYWLKRFPSCFCGPSGLYLMFPEDHSHGFRAVSDLVVQSRTPAASGLVTHPRAPTVTDLGDDQWPLARSDIHDDDRMSTYSGGTFSGLSVDYSGCESLLCKACGNVASEQLEACMRRVSMLMSARMPSTEKTFFHRQSKLTTSFTQM